MSKWYIAYNIDGQSRPILDGDHFKTFDSSEEVKQALDRWASEYHKEGRTVAICKEMYEKTFDEFGRIVRIENTIEAVEYYKVADCVDSNGLRRAI